MLIITSTKIFKLHLNALLEASHFQNQVTDENIMSFIVILNLVLFFTRKPILPRAFEN